MLEFREALQNPKLDPLPLAQELYKILLGPVAKDLAKAKTQTIMWSLDGVLRYVPVSALNDGKQYLVEQYQNVVFTPASQARLKDAPARNWDALGLGVTKAHGERIPALPGVLDEMRGIIRESVINRSKSNQPGASRVVKLMSSLLQGSDAQRSYGSGPRSCTSPVTFSFHRATRDKLGVAAWRRDVLSLAQIKSLPNIFGGVDLLTLSAATRRRRQRSHGKEVEGFGVLAQRQGEEGRGRQLVAGCGSKHKAVDAGVLPIA